ncbi:hypothetical protein P3S68_028643 [Capsicum galapagoense]
MLQWLLLPWILTIPELNVYHAASAFVNPLLVSQLFDYFYEFFQSLPYVNSKGDQVKVKKMKYFDNISNFSNYIFEQHDEVQDLTEVEHANMQLRFKRKVEYLENFSKMYETYGFYNGRVSQWQHAKTNGRKMSEEERKNFDSDLSKINWRDYFLGIHIPGVRTCIEWKNSIFLRLYLFYFVRKNTIITYLV